MKNFLIGFFGTLFASATLIAIGVGATSAANYFIEDPELCILFGLLFVAATMIGFLFTFSDEE